jgi:hypothetical protein
VNEDNDNDDDRYQVADEAILVKDMEEMRRKFLEGSSAGSFGLHDAESGCFVQVQFSGYGECDMVRLSDLLEIDPALPRLLRLALAVELAQAVLTYRDAGLVAENLREENIWFNTENQKVFLNDLILLIDPVPASLHTGDQSDDTARTRCYSGEEFARVSTSFGLILVNILLLKKTML